MIMVIPPVPVLRTAPPESVLVVLSEALEDEILPFSRVFTIPDGFATKVCGLAVPVVRTALLKCVLVLSEFEVLVGGIITIPGQILDPDENEPSCPYNGCEEPREAVASRTDRKICARSGVDICA